MSKQPSGDFDAYEDIIAEDEGHDNEILEAVRILGNAFSFEASYSHLLSTAELFWEALEADASQIDSEADEKPRVSEKVEIAASQFLWVIHTYKRCLRAFTFEFGSESEHSRRKHLLGWEFGVDVAVLVKKISIMRLNEDNLGYLRDLAQKTGGFAELGKIFDGVVGSALKVYADNSKDVAGRCANAISLLNNTISTEATKDLPKDVVDILREHIEEDLRRASLALDNAEHTDNISNRIARRTDTSSI